jgi:hypothetical protein
MKKYISRPHTKRRGEDHAVVLVPRRRCLPVVVDAVSVTLVSSTSPRYPRPSSSALMVARNGRWESGGGGDGRPLPRLPLVVGVVA